MPPDNRWGRGCPFDAGLVDTFLHGRDRSHTVDDCLVLESEESVHDCELQNLPDGAWPPTPWHAAWVSGLDVFDVRRHGSTIEMRWLVYRKADV